MKLKSLSCRQIPKSGREPQEVLDYLHLGAKAILAAAHGRGLHVGPRVFSRPNSWLLNQNHLREAQEFYDRHGRKTIILARFVPIIRTFAPFVAGVGRMRFSRFIGFSVAGGVVWVMTVTLAGYKFGRVRAVQDHFEWVILAIVAISLIPVGLHAWQARRHGVPASAAARPKRAA
jgi:membrane-associated protein